MTLTNLLCKYFSEDDNHDRVTISSFIGRLLLFCGIAFGIILFIYGNYTWFFRDTSFIWTKDTPSPSKILGGLILSGVALLDIAGIVLGVIVCIRYIGSIEITKCERKP
jgi:hypothetical protein